MPIIKSIGRKDTNFGQLIGYLHQDDPGQEKSFTYLHNMSGVAPDDLEGIERAFQENNEYRHKRKNGVGQFHEVIGFHPDDTSYLLEHPEILEEMSRVYLELRAPDAIAIARPHVDKGHIHLHYIISPNEVGNSTSIRMSKKRFQAVRRTMEKFQLEQYPELKNSYVRERDKEKYKEVGKTKTTSHKEQQMMERGASANDKQEVASTTRAMLNSVDDRKTFEQVLQEQGMQTYRYKGRLQGVVYNGKKYRFSRLVGKESGLLDKVAQWDKLEIDKDMFSFDKRRGRSRLEK